MRARRSTISSCGLPARSGQVRSRAQGGSVPRRRSASLRALAHLMCALHTVCMKRTNLVLPEELLREVVQISGEKTFSGAVMVAMQEFVRRAKARQILKLRGSGAWEGDLGEMRGDASPPPRRKAR